MTAGRVGDADLIDKEDVETAVGYALAAQYLGMKLLYLEAGSGAYYPVSDEMIKSVKENTDIPLIVGGGIRSVDTAREKARAEELGYDTFMIFVDTSLPVALERNAKRERVLPEKAVKDLWQQVQDNKDRYEALFGDNFVIVDNTKFAYFVKAFSTNWDWSASQRIMGAVITYTIDEAL